MIKTLLLALFLLSFNSCSSSKDKVIASNSSCSSNKLISKHMRIYAQYNLNSLKNCISNYVRLNKKKLSVTTCNNVTINKYGKASSARVTGDNLPTDLKWCIEQALWKADYSKLQISKKTFVKFPLSFEYK